MNPVEIFEMMIAMMCAIIALQYGARKLRLPPAWRCSPGEASWCSCRVRLPFR